MDQGEVLAEGATHIQAGTSREKRETRALRERFLEKIRKTENCWEWTAAKNSDGYGIIGVGGHGTVRAHRLAYKLFVGPIPEGKQVLHRCDNPGCINPSHLWIGMDADNQADSVAKGRHARGESHGRSKLSWSQVQEIRSQYQRGSHEFGSYALARHYGISRREIRDVVRGQSWRT
jgi:hypothetical protein